MTGDCLIFERNYRPVHKVSSGGCFVRSSIMASLRVSTNRFQNLCTQSIIEYRVGDGDAEQCGSGWVTVKTAHHIH
jgi:hypothetical protein